MAGWEGPICSECWPGGPRTRQQSLSKRSEEKKTTAQLQCRSVHLDVTRPDLAFHLGQKSY